MTRWLIPLAVVLLAAVGGLTVYALVGGGRETAVTVGEDGRPLRLTADRHVSPALVKPSGEYLYRFSVTDTGERAVRNVAVRSEKVLGARTGTGLDVRGVSDPACSGQGGRVACFFAELKPGETRTVLVSARASPDRLPGDRLRIRTFLARIVPDSSIGVEYDVVGAISETTGTFVAR